MRILIITASLPYPPASGGAIRTLGILKGLHQAEHEITLLSFHDGQIEPKTTPLATYCTRIEILPPPERATIDRLRTLLFTRQPDIATRFYSDDFAEVLHQLLMSQQFDLVQIEAIEAVAYLPLVKQWQPPAKIVFDTFNAEYMLQRKIYEIDRGSLKRLPLALYSYLQIGRIARFEGEMCRLADAVIAVSEEDADLLRGFRKDEVIWIVPSGVIVADYAKVTAPVELPPNTLVFTGKMDYRPNVDAMLWFTEAILPLVRQQVPDVQLYIVGQKPHPRLDHLRDLPHVHITGWVDATQPYLHAADVYVAPLRMGSGTRLKLLEAMSSQCAIVATTLASAGLHSGAKAGMIVTDDAQEMAIQITTLLNDPTQRQKLGETALQQVQATYDWSVLIPRLLAVYEGLGLG